MKSFISGVLGALTILIAAAIIVSQYADYRAQPETSGWFNLIKDTQDQIASRILKSGTVKDSGTNIEIPQALKNLEHTRITDDGIIFLKGGSSGQFITLTPSLVDDKLVVWQCIGGSNDNMLQKCKSS